MEGFCMWGELEIEKGSCVITTYKLSYFLLFHFSQRHKVRSVFKSCLLSYFWLSIDLSVSRFSISLGL